MEETQGPMPSPSDESWDHQGRKAERKQRRGARVALPVYLTKPEVAQLLRVDRKTVERWARDHGLPCERMVGSVRYVLSDVLRWASARREGI